MSNLRSLEQLPSVALETGYTGPIDANIDGAAAAIGALMPFLDDRHSGNPIDPDLLSLAANSADHDQIVRTDARRPIVIGTHSLSVGHTVTGTEIRLGDFVVHPEATGRDIDGKSPALDQWHYMTKQWGPAHGAKTLGFESELWREQAHRFYLRNGASMKTGVQHWAIDHLPTDDDSLVGARDANGFTGVVSQFSNDLMRELALLYPGVDLDAQSIKQAIEKPGHDLLIARRGRTRQLVGAVMLSTSIGPFEQVTARPNSAVVAEAARQDGVAYDLWRGVIEFARRHNATGGINFEIPEDSRAIWSNDAAFYTRAGLELDEDNVHFVTKLGAAA